MFLQSNTCCSSESFLLLAFTWMIVKTYSWCADSDTTYLHIWNGMRYFIFFLCFWSTNEILVWNVRTTSTRLLLEYFVKTGIGRKTKKPNSFGPREHNKPKKTNIRLQLEFVAAYPFGLLICVFDLMHILEIRWKSMFKVKYFLWKDQDFCFYF